MVRVPLQNVRVMSLREIAELWAPEARIPEAILLRELRIAVINIPRLREGLDLVDDIPPDDELPDPDERVDRDWLIEFCDKQGWREPGFWFDPAGAQRRFPGRPGYPHRLALEDELRRRGVSGELLDTLAGEMGRLRDWAQQEFPRDVPPTEKTLKNTFRDLYRQLRQEAQN